MLRKINWINRIYTKYKQRRALLKEIRNEIESLKRTLNYSSCINDYVITQRSLNSIENNFKNGKTNAKLAFVSILPNDSSGIATTSLFSFANSCNEFHIFTKPKCHLDFLMNENFLEKNLCSLFHVDHLVYANQLFNYKKIIIAIGGSDHHGYIFKLIKELQDYSLMDKVVLYMHDLTLHYLLFNSMNVSLFEYIEKICHSYNLSENEKNILKKDIRSKFDLNRILVKDFKISGSRFFFERGITNYLVNSETARNFLQTELKENINIQKIFNPIVNGYIKKQQFKNKLIERGTNDILIGTFGVVHDAKRINDLIIALRLLKEKKLDKSIKLIIAGWYANDYFKNKTIDDFIVKIDSPSSAELDQLMSEIDFAVQLRRDNMGESSGVVPMLLYHNKITLVSNLGSFSEIGDAVFYIEENDGPEQIANKLLLMISNSQAANKATAIKEYINQHSTENFTKNLVDFYY